MKSNIKIHCLEDLDEISNFAFNLFFELHQKGDNRFYIIPGGNTPNQLYKLLSNNINDWKNTKLLLSDERISDNKRLSNEAMVNDELLDRIKGVEKPTLIKYYRTGNQLKIENNLKTISPNLAILGLGADGHTASLFPEDSNILTENNICLKIKNPWESFERISLSFSYLMKSNQIIFLASGESKAEALAECIVGNYNPIQYPAQIIFQNYTKNIHVLCDNSARKYIT